MSTEVFDSRPFEETPMPSMSQASPDWMGDDADSLIKVLVSTIRDKRVSADIAAMALGIPSEIVAETMQKGIDDLRALIPSREAVFAREMTKAHFDIMVETIDLMRSRTIGWQGAKATLALLFPREFPETGRILKALPSRGPNSMKELLEAISNPPPPEQWNIE